jgi:hypothetical protein
MRQFGLLFTVVLLLSSSPPAFVQKPVDGVVVTGDVTDIVLCSHEDGAWIYRLIIKLHAKNVGLRPVIVSGADAMTDYYKVANTLNSLKSKQYAHIGWVTSAPQGNTKKVPETPVKPFKVVAPNASIDINIDLRAIVVGELKPGSEYLQLVAENWPDSSDDYIPRITRAWSSYGILWAHSLHSEPIAFVVPPNLKKVRCP